MPWHLVCSCADFRVYSGLEPTVFATAAGSGALLLVAVLWATLAWTLPATARSSGLYVAVPNAPEAFLSDTSASRRRRPARRRV